MAEIIVKEAIAKVKDKRTKTPFQRKYKKTYNATWEVSYPGAKIDIGRKGGRHHGPGNFRGSQESLTTMNIKHLNLQMLMLGFQFNLLYSYMND